MVIADRMALMVNQVFDHYADYHGAVILAAAIGYVIQLYMEFSGCMDIIIGSGKLFGICLPKTSDSRSVRRILRNSAQMAYYTRRVVQGIYFLSGIGIRIG